jgi:hypothetical protein
VSDFDSNPKSKYQQRYKRFHSLCVLVGKPRGMISRRVHKVRQAHNRANRISPLSVSEYDSITSDVQRALDDCISHLDAAENKLKTIIKMKRG